MGVAGQRQRAVLRVALAQVAQARAELAGGDADAVALPVVKAGGGEVEVGGELPDPLGFDAGGDAGDVGGGRGRPVELGEGGLCGGEKRRHYLVTGEDVGGLGDLGEKERELGEVRVEVD